MIWLATCEHYSNLIPTKFGYLFEKDNYVLDTHRGYDIGAASLFESVSPLFDHTFHYPFSRLLIEPNRSLHHQHLFSEFSSQLDRPEKNALILDYYQPYRKQVTDLIAANSNEIVLHIGIHTFTPSFKDQNRETKIGILYDPKHSSEKQVASIWKSCLQKETEEKIRFNYPYKGASDGFTTSLRKTFPNNYLGFELEIRNDAVDKLRLPLFNSLENLISSSLIRILG